MQSLAEKYRPRTEGEIKGQPNVQLIFDLSEQYIAPCYLFYGTTGCGKTSSAKVLISKIENVELNLLHNYKSDVIEHNCSMNGGVDQIKELILDKCNLPPRQLKHKYIILDECQVLSNTSQNALLNILECPPHYLTFILCTTDPRKIIQAIQSRSLRVKFIDALTKDICDLLTDICQKENIIQEPEALEMIAQNASGSFREAIMILAQFQKIGATKENVMQYAGGITKTNVNNLLIYAISKQHQALITELNQLTKSNVKPEEVLKIALLIITEAMQQKVIDGKSLFGNVSLIKVSNIILEHLNLINPAIPDTLNLQLCFFKLASIVQK